MPATLSVLAAIPDHVRHPAEENATEISDGIKHVTAAVRQDKMLDQLADGRMQGEYYECPAGADTHHEGREDRGGEDGKVDDLVKTVDVRPCRGTGGIKHHELHGHGY